MAAGTICETGETGENAVVVVEQIESLTGLTGLPPFPCPSKRRVSRLPVGGRQFSSVAVRSLLLRRCLLPCSHDQFLV